MAKKVQIQVEIDGTKESLKTIRELEDAQSKLNEQLKDAEIGSKEYKKLNKELKKTEEGLASSGKGASKGLGLISKGFKGIGIAMKGAGIGLVIGLVAKLTDFLMKQQPIVDALNVAFTAIDMVFRQVSDAISSAFESTSKANGGFEATKKVIGGLIDVSLFPLKTLFIGLQAAVTGIQLAWEKSIFGDGDTTRIAELEQELSDLGDEMVQLAEDTAQSAVDIVTNVGEMASEVGGFVGEVVEKVSEIDLKESLNAAEALVNLRKRAELAAATNDLLLQQYDKEAERLRQIRDDENRSMSERMAANESLGALLDKQEKTMLANANLQLKLAQEELKLNDNQENRLKLIEAQKDIQDVMATVEGFRSEQLTNRVSLERESLEISKSQKEAENARAISQAEFNAELKDGNVERINGLLEAVKLEKELELTRLKSIIDSTKEGTAARVEAEQTYLDKVQELNQKEIELHKEKEEAKTEKEKEESDKRKEEQAKRLADTQAKVNKAVEVFNQISSVANEVMNRRLEKETDAIEGKYDLENQKLQENLNAGLISKREYDRSVKELERQKQVDLLKEKRKAFNREKALNITNATIQGAQAVLNAFASGVATPLIGPATGAIYAGIAGAFAATQIGLIASQQFRAARGGVVPGSGPSTIDSVPSLLAPGETVINAASSRMFASELSAINQAGGGIPLAPTNVNSEVVEPKSVFRDNNNTVVKAYVTESDISSTQRRVNRIEESSSF